MKITIQLNPLDGYDMYTLYLAGTSSVEEYLLRLTEEAMQRDKKLRICSECEAWVFPLFTVDAVELGKTTITATSRQVCQCGGKAVGYARSKETMERQRDIDEALDSVRFDLTDEQRDESDALFDAYEKATNSQAQTAVVEKLCGYVEHHPELVKS